MEPYTQVQVPEKHFFNRITPFSKYLALTFFVTIPIVTLCIGYWVGIKNAVVIAPANQNENHVQSLVPEEVVWVPLSDQRVQATEDFWFYIQDGQVFGQLDKLLSGADAESFTVPLSPEGNPIGLFAKDKNHFYNDGGSRLDGVDKETFSVVWDKTIPAEQRCEPFAKDKNHVYFPRVGCGTVNPDGSTSVSYKCSQVYELADPETFQNVYVNGQCSPYEKDKDRVFYGQYHLENSDSTTFAVMEGLYSRDANDIYVRAGRINASVNIASFTPIRDAEGKLTHYAKDKNNVYHIYVQGGSGDIVQGADPQTFVYNNSHEWTPECNSGMESCYDASDAVHRYYLGELVN